jgi:hypothetical protein
MCEVSMALIVLKNTILFGLFVCIETYTAYTFLWKLLKENHKYRTLPRSFLDVDNELLQVVFMDVNVYL